MGLVLRCGARGGGGGGGVGGGLGHHLYVGDLSLHLRALDAAFKVDAGALSQKKIYTRTAHPARLPGELTTAPSFDVHLFYSLHDWGGGRRILSATVVVSASRSMAYITGRGRVFIPFLCAV